MLQYACFPCLLHPNPVVKNWLSGFLWLMECQITLPAAKYTCIQHTLWRTEQSNSVCLHLQSVLRYDSSSQLWLDVWGVRVARMSSALFRTQVNKGQLKNVTFFFRINKNNIDDPRWSGWDHVTFAERGQVIIVIIKEIQRGNFTADSTVSIQCRV